MRCGSGNARIVVALLRWSAHGRALHQPVVPPRRSGATARVRTRIAGEGGSALGTRQHAADGAPAHAVAFDGTGSARLYSTLTEPRAALVDHADLPRGAAYTGAIDSRLAWSLVDDPALYGISDLRDRGGTRGASSAARAATVFVKANQPQEIGRAIVAGTRHHRRTATRRSSASRAAVVMSSSRRDTARTRSAAARSAAARSAAARSATARLASAGTTIGEAPSPRFVVPSARVSSPRRGSAERCAPP